jgi:hypothetical protein
VVALFKRSVKLPDGLKPGRESDLNNWTLGLAKLVMGSIQPVLLKRFYRRNRQVFFKEAAQMPRRYPKTLGDVPQR